MKLETARQRETLKEYILGFAILGVSAVALWLSIIYIAGTKITPEMRRADVCSEHGRERAVVFIENDLKDRLSLPKFSQIGRRDTYWLGDCNFIMVSSVVALGSNVRFSTAVRFDPENGAWHLSNLDWWRLDETLQAEIK